MSHVLARPLPLDQLQRAADNLNQIVSRYTESAPWLSRGHATESQTIVFNELPVLPRLCTGCATPIGLKRFLSDFLPALWPVTAGTRELSFREINAGCSILAKILPQLGFRGEPTVDVGLAKFSLEIKASSIPKAELLEQAAAPLWERRGKYVHVPVSEHPRYRALALLIHNFLEETLGFGGDDRLLSTTYLAPNVLTPQVLDFGVSFYLDLRTPLHRDVAEGHAKTLRDLGFTFSLAADDDPVGYQYVLVLDRKLQEAILPLKQ